MSSTQSILLPSIQCLECLEKITEESTRKKCRDSKKLRLIDAPFAKFSDIMVMVLAIKGKENYRLYYVGKAVDESIARV